MKIGYIQFAPVLGRPEETIKRLKPLIQKGADADLLVLPELCNSGYNFTSPKMARSLGENVKQSEFISFIAAKCKEFDLHIVTGFNELDEGELFNSAILVGPNGVIGTYRKLHLFMNEKDYFEPGNLGLPVFDIGKCKVGMAVCFDWMFPEAFRVLALKGADIICHPANLVLPGFAQQSIPVHALLNHVYIVTANRIGTEDNLTFTGNSILANPKGKVLASAPEDQPEVKILDVELALAKDKAITPRNHAFNDRRPSEYKVITEE